MMQLSRESQRTAVYGLVIGLIRVRPASVMKHTQLLLNTWVHPSLEPVDHALNNHVLSAFIVCIFV